MDSTFEDVIITFPYEQAISEFSYIAPELYLEQLSRFVARPSNKHVGTVSRALQYLRGMQNYGITYTKTTQASDPIIVQVCCDSYWANDVDARKSTTEILFTLYGRAIAWITRLNL